MSGYHNHLLHLTYIRLVTLCVQSAALLFALYGLQAQIDGALVASTLAILALINLFTFARLHSPWPVTELELFSQLVADAVLYGALIYQTGGATNPFIFLLLIPLIISAATLSWRLTWLMALLVVVLYSSLLQFYLPILPPLSEHQHSLPSLFDLHVTGMWLNFIFTVLLVTWFVVRMQQTMRTQERRLAQERERRLQDQQLLALATLAAGTAHDLGTPLSTMSVVLKDLALDHAEDPELAEDIALLRQQVALCSERLQQMARSARQGEQLHWQPVDQLLTQLLDEWQLMRPEVSFDYRCDPTPAPALQASYALRQALMNLLNNAADANPNAIQIQLSWSTHQIWLRIHDQGPGLPLEQADSLGKPFVTTKGKGLGLGLFLTATTLTRQDGEVRLYNHPTGGTLAEVCLPIQPRPTHLTTANRTGAEETRG